MFLGNSKLLFPKVPSTVYPTTQSVLQQDDNEVIDSLSPAYKELSRTHFSYVSCFNGSITTDASYCGNNQSTILPNSTRTSIQPHTNSLSSEQLNIQRLCNDSQQRACYDSRRNTSKAESINNSSITTDEASTDTETTVSPLSTKPEQSNDSSLSIHITTAPNDPQRCPTSSTSGILNGNSEDIIEPANDEINQPAINGDQNEPVMNDTQLNETVINDKRSNEHVTNDQRLCTEVCGPNKNAATISGKNTNSNAIRCDSSRGASSFGGVELSPKTRAFSPDYYALTFRREGSNLSEVSCSSMRGASAFGGSTINCFEQKLPVTVSTAVVNERGASVFGQTSQALYLENRPMIKQETGNQSSRPFHNPELSSVNCNGSQMESGSSSTMKVISHEPENYPYQSKIDSKSTTMSPSHGFNHRMTEVVANSIQSVERNSSKLQRENQNSRKLRKIPSYGNISVLSNINNRTNSQTSTKSCKTNSKKGERAIGLGIVSGHGKDYSATSMTSETYKCSMNDKNKKPISLPNNHNTPNSRETHVNLDEPITRIQSSSRDKPQISISQNIHGDSSRAMKTHDTKSNPKTPHLINNTYQSLRGASQFGRFGDINDQDVCSDNDALWDSISLSFAYESPSEDDDVPQLELKETERDSF